MAMLNNQRVHNAYCWWMIHAFSWWMLVSNICLFCFSAYGMTFDSWPTICVWNRKRTRKWDDHLQLTNMYILHIITSIIWHLYIHTYIYMIICVCIHVLYINLYSKCAHLESGWAHQPPPALRSSPCQMAWWSRWGLKELHRRLESAKLVKTVGYVTI